MKATPGPTRRALEHPCHRNMKSKVTPMKNLIERRLVVQGGLAAVSGLMLRARAAEATDPADLTLEAASELVRRRRISPVELTKACLGRIERQNPKLNAFTTITADRALEQARVAE